MTKSTWWMTMLELQSVTTQRSQQVQLTTDILSSNNDQKKSIVNNIGGGGGGTPAPAGSASSPLGQKTKATVRR